jgi:hypothetical protein
VVTIAAVIRISRPCVVSIAEPSLLKLDAGQEGVEGGAIGTGIAAAGRVLGCEHVGGPIMHGGRYPHQEAAARPALHVQQPAGSPPIVMAWSVCGVAGHGCAAAARVVVLV